LSCMNRHTISYKEAAALSPALSLVEHIK
jgi:hypothetical protein